MAAVTVWSDFGAQENEVCHYFHCSIKKPQQPRGAQKLMATEGRCFPSVTPFPRLAHPGPRGIACMVNPHSEKTKGRRALVGTLPYLPPSLYTPNSCFLQQVKQSIQNTVITDLPGAAVGRNLPANAGDTSSIPGPGRPHMPWVAKAHTSPLLSLCPRAHGPQLLKRPALQSLCPTAREATTTRRPRTTTRESLHALEPMLHSKTSHPVRSPCPARKSHPHSLHPQKALEQRQTPSAATIK